MVYFIFIILWFIISLPSLIQIGIFLCQCATNSGSGRVAAVANAKQTATVSVHTSYVVYTVLGTGEANVAAEAHENTKENK